MKNEDEVFEQEKAEALAQDCVDGICECCEGSMYYAIDVDPEEKHWDNLATHNERFSYDDE